MATNKNTLRKAAHDLPKIRILGRDENLLFAQRLSVDCTARRHLSLSGVTSKSRPTTVRTISFGSQASRTPAVPRWRPTVIPRPAIG